MLIKESEIMSSPLDNIQYIEQPITEAAIPVAENSRLGKYVVSIEDISEFCENTNGDPGYVISRICESNGINSDSLAFSIKEESIILGEDAANISVSLMNEGAGIFATPTKHDELWINIGEELKSIIESSLDEVSAYWVKNKLGGISFFPKEDKERPAKQSDVDYYAYTYSTKPNVKKK